MQIYIKRFWIEPKGLVPRVVTTDHIRSIVLDVYEIEYSPLEKVKLDAKNIFIEKLGLARSLLPVP